MTWQSALPLRVEDRGRAVRVDAGEGVLSGGGAHSVDGDLQVAVGAVLEADGHRQPRSELAVDLALGRARPDRAPGDGVGDVLRGDRIQELAADGRPVSSTPSSTRRARRSPALTSPEPSRCGSLIRPFQPVVVRGFSK